RHTSSTREWSSDVCSSDLGRLAAGITPLEVGLGIHVRVAQEFETAAVKLIAAGLEHDVYHGALIASVLSGKVIGNDLILLDCILVVHKERGTANGEVVVVGAVNREVVRPSTIAVYRQRRAVAVDVAET